MPFNTLSVATAITPSVVETYFSHYLNRGSLKKKPTAHISYHEGLRLIREFLDYSSKHTVEDIQAFTAQWVPAPHWVRTDEVEIPSNLLDRAAELLCKQLGHQGIDRVGGRTWWKWRRDGGELKAEWIEMKKDYNERKRTQTRGERLMLYVHGGAYYFGSVEEHRYQMQRHARKLKARVLAPRYRLAPQFPFPCGLFDCLASYLYVLEYCKPSQILIAGDSAGGGMVLSMLVILRDQGIALPAGAILLSPWVDLTHSFPSVAGDSSYDYIPSHGFHHKPSMFWPPPSSGEMKLIAKNAVQTLIDKEKEAGMHSHGAKKTKQRIQHDKKEEQEEQEAMQGFTVDEHLDVDKQNNPNNPNNPAAPRRPDTRAGNTISGPGHDLSIMLDGKMVEIIDQIQLYTTNQLISHPLVSPVLSPSLGGLPPLLIQVGGGELLRDEQVYIAHKAANPTAYPPSDAVLDEHDPHRESVSKYPPTDVQLQVWDDLCHVAHTLSFTRPAKYMYRSVAQFGAWAFAHAQNKDVEIVDDDNVSFISSGSDNDKSDPSASTTSLPINRQATNGISNNGSILNVQIRAHTVTTPTGAVGKAGDPIPSFNYHMIRQRIDRHGVIYPLALPSSIASLHLDPAAVGVIKAGPVRKWLAAKKESDRKFASEKRKVQKKRVKEMAQGYDVTAGSDEVPPPTALAGRRTKDMPEETKRKGKSWGLAMWSGWGSSHDQDTLEREEKAERRPAREGPGTEGQQISVSHVKPEAGTTEPTVRRATAESKSRRRIASMLGGSLRPASQSMGGSGQGSDTNRLSMMSRARRGSGATASDRPGSVAIPNGELSPALSQPTSPPVERMLHSDTTTRPLANQGPPSAENNVYLAAGTSRPLAGDKLAGTGNTYLASGSSRPHNGTVAYPFKLRNPVYNPSTATLESQAADGTLPAFAVGGTRAKQGARE